MQRRASRERQAAVGDAAQRLQNGEHLARGRRQGQDIYREVPARSAVDKRDDVAAAASMSIAPVGPRLHHVIVERGGHDRAAPARRERARVGQRADVSGRAGVEQRALLVDEDAGATGLGRVTSPVTVPKFSTRLLKPMLSMAKSAAPEMIVPKFIRVLAMVERSMMPARPGSGRKATICRSLARWRPTPDHSPRGPGSSGRDRSA